MNLSERPAAYEVYGFFDLAQGLRYAADATVETLKAHEELVRLHHVSDRLSERSIVPGRAVRAGDVNLFHINPNQLLALLGQRHENPAFEARVNALVPFWEVTAIPLGWREVLSVMDVVVAPTPFVGQIMRGASLGVPVIEHHTVVDVPFVDADRARFGLPEGAVVFGLAFGSEAVIARKNPLAVIDAFLSAFPDDQDVRLAIRMNPTGTSVDSVADDLRRAGRGDTRIVHIQEALSYTEILSFYASLDAYVSLHRAEGLGLGLMESMAVGTPVIATGWSGNMGFMSAEDSMLVGYDLVPVIDVPGSPYNAELLESKPDWAEPRLADAVEAMRTLRASHVLRTSLGEKALGAYRRALRASQRADLTGDLAATLAASDLSAGSRVVAAARLRAMESSASRGRSLSARIRRRLGSILRSR